MSLAHLKRRVERAETLVEGRVQQATECQARLKRQWRDAWTPLRIVVAGLGAGLVTGSLRPEKAIGRIGRIAGPKSIQLMTSAIGLAGSLHAAMSAMGARAAAGAAAETSEDAAHAAAAPAAHAGRPAPARPADSPATAPRRQAEPPRRHDQRWDSQPSPAEAATEVSER